MVYLGDQMTNILSLTNPPIQMMPQGPASRTRYMESCLDTALLYATAISKSIDTYTTPYISAANWITVTIVPLRQETAHICIRYLMLSPSSQQFYGHVFRLDSTHNFRFD